MLAGERNIIIDGRLTVSIDPILLKCAYRTDGNVHECNGWGPSPTMSSPQISCSPCEPFCRAQDSTTTTQDRLVIGRAKWRELTSGNRNGIWRGQDSPLSIVL